MNQFESKFRQTMKEKDLFLSSEYRQHFQNLADMVTQRFNERISIKILWCDPQTTAYTDNETVSINANCDMMRTREERFVGCTAFLAHELGHVLYTDFRIRNEVIGKIEAGELPQSAANTLPDDTATMAIRNSIQSAPASFASIFAHIENCLEDRYIEHEISKFYEGTFKSGLEFIQSVFRENSKSCEVNLMNCVLMQARGVLTAPALKSYPLLSTAECYIDHVNDTHNYLHRVQNVFEYIHHIWDYIEPLIKENYNAENDHSAKKSSESGNRDTAPISSDDNAAGLDHNASRKADINTSSVLDDAAEKLDSIISEIARALQSNDKAKQSVNDKYDMMTCAELACSGIDSGVDCVVTTLPKSNSTSFDVVQIRKISSELQQRVQRSIIRRENGIKKTGLSVGRKIDVRAYARGDTKMFTKTSYPNKKPILSVCVALDGSGSMAGDRLTAAKKALLILEDFCRNTHVPLSAFGFDYGDGKNRIAKFFDFGDTNDKTAYKRIFSYKSGNTNRDGFAVKFAHQKLKTRKEINRLLVIISDGKPTAYSRTEDGIADIQQSIKQLHRERITPIALAIGDDMDTLKTIYGEALVDARELDKLPLKLTQYLQRYLI